MIKAQSISCTKLQNKVGNKYDVIVDSVKDKLAICRTMSDAPEIDGNLFIDKETKYLKQGDIVKVRVTDATDYDLFGELLNEN